MPTEPKRRHWGRNLAIGFASVTLLVVLGQSLAWFFTMRARRQVISRLDEFQTTYTARCMSSRYTDDPSDGARARYLDSHAIQTEVAAQTNVLKSGGSCDAVALALTRAGYPPTN